MSSKSCQHATTVPAAEHGNSDAEQCMARTECSGLGQHRTPAGAATDLDAALKAAEAASSVEALAGRRVALLDRCVESVSTTEWLWDDAPAATNVSAAAVQAKAVSAVAVGVGADSNMSGGVAIGLRDGVNAAALDVVLQGVHESALACFAGATGKADDAHLRPAVQCSIPFRQGMCLSGANVLRALRPVLHCGTRTAAFGCARAAITMAADEYTDADEREDSGARRSRRQRQRGYCAELFHKFDFSLSQFSDAALGSSK